MVAPLASQSVVAAQRILRGVTANIDVTFLDQEGEPTTAAGTVTVDVTKDDGTVVATGAATTTTTGDDGSALYRYALAAQANLELLTFVWKDSGVERMRTQVDVVGAYYFSTAAVRAFDPSITVTKYSSAQIIAARREVEDQCELITGCAWVPRYRRARFDSRWGQGRLLLDRWAPRTIRSVRQYNDATNYVALTSPELAAVSFTEWGQLVRRDGQAWWGNFGGIVVEWEHGYDAPPPDLRHAVLTHLRYQLNREKSGIPDRATSFVPAEGGNFTIATPGRAGFETGIPDVDAVYLRYSKKFPAAIA